jgi:hypothetical protein
MNDGRPATSTYGRAGRAQAIRGVGRRLRGRLTALLALIALALIAASPPPASPAPSTSAGQLYAFGDNRFGQLGSATGNANPTPTLVALPGGGVNARAKRCRVPDVRGYELAYARDLIEGGHCRLGIVHRTARSGARVVLAETPPPGSLIQGGRRVDLRLGPRPHQRGCQAPRFQVRAHTPQAYAWEMVLGNPNGPNRWSETLEGCAPPHGPMMTLWSADHESVGLGGASFSKLETAGHVVAFVASSFDQYGSEQRLEVFDLARTSTSSRCAQCASPVVDVLVGLIPPAVGTLSGQLQRYVLDPSGDVAWLQRTGSAQTLYLATPQSPTPSKVDTGPDLSDVRLADGKLTWASGGQARSEAITATVAAIRPGHTATRRRPR